MVKIVPRARTRRGPPLPSVTLPLSLRSSQVACSAELSQPGATEATGGIGDTHSRTRPFLIAGSAGRYFRSGRYVKSVRSANRTPHDKLSVSIAKAMDVERGANDLFGDPQFCTGPLSGLTA